MRKLIKSIDHDDGTDNNFSQNTMATSRRWRHVTVALLFAWLECVGRVNGLLGSMSTLSSRTSFRPTSWSFVAAPLRMVLEQETNVTLAISSDRVDTPYKPATSVSASQVEEDDPVVLLQQQQRRNTAVAILSVALAISNYLWQFTHPISPVQLLATMQQTSDPLTIIGTNQRPTVVDFWAPWCENCKLFAPTLQKVEQEYRGEVNFCMVNGDDQPKVLPYLDAFGVDAIPHLALVSADGTVETALIGPIPKSVLKADLDTLIHNAQATKEDQKQELPYTMLDVFANRPAERKVHFEE